VVLRLIIFVKLQKAITAVDLVPSVGEKNVYWLYTPPQEGDMMYLASEQEAAGDEEGDRSLASQRTGLTASTMASELSRWEPLPEGTWRSYTGMNYPDPDVDCDCVSCTTQAELEAAKRKAEELGCLAFSVLNGLAMLKRMERPLTEDDLERSAGEKNIFYLYIPPQPEVLETADVPTHQEAVAPAREEKPAEGSWTSHRKRDYVEEECVVHELPCRSDDELEAAKEWAVENGCAGFALCNQTARFKRPKERITSDDLDQVAAGTVFWLYTPP